MLLSVVLVNWNSRSDLEACLLSLRAQTHRELEIVVIDNASTDGSVEMVRASFPEVRILPQTENLGFAEACNLGIDATRGEWVAMLNNDTVADPRWAEELVRASTEVEPRCGMLQSLMLFQETPDRVNSTGIILTGAGRGQDRDEGAARPTGTARQEIFCPTAGAAAYRRAMLRALRLSVGYFDRDHFCYYEDMDLGWRCRLAGFSAYFVPTSIVHHAYHGSTKRKGAEWIYVTSQTNRLRMLAKNASWGFILRTARESAREVIKVLRMGGGKAGLGLVRAVREGMAQRAHVEALAEVPRASIERAWAKGD